MPNYKKLYNDLINTRRLKRKEFRKPKREEEREDRADEFEINLILGSVWGIHDKRVPFDFNRKAEHIKDKLRPCLVIEKHNNLSRGRFVLVAPGTSTYHPDEKDEDLTLTAYVPPEELNQTTYFLIYYRWHTFQKNLESKFCDLSTGKIHQLENLMGKINEQR